MATDPALAKDAMAKGKAMGDQIVKNCEDDGNWLMSLDENNRASMGGDAQNDLALTYSLANAAKLAGDSATAANYQHRGEILQKSIAYLVQQQQQQQ
jgi:hypothetical protein